MFLILLIFLELNIIQSEYKFIKYKFIKKRNTPKCGSFFSKPSEAFHTYITSLYVKFIPV